MGHVGSKTKSPSQILGNSCLHYRGLICDLNLMNLSRMFVRAISGLSLGHDELKTRSPGQIF